MNIQWNNITWYSKLGAIILFIGVLPVLSFYIGTQYELAQQAAIVPADTVATTAHTEPVGKSAMEVSGMQTGSDTSSTSAKATAPHIISLTPSHGTSGLTITIKGTGFTSSNVISFGKADGRNHTDGTPDNQIAKMPSADGTTVTFNVPTTGPSGLLCDANNLNCKAVTGTVLPAGSYPVTVSTKSGTSNTLQFTLSR